MAYFERISRWFSGVLNLIAAGSIFVMMLLTCSDVVMRLFRIPIPGTYEVVGFFGAVAISFALSKTTVGHGHIVVKILTSLTVPI